MAPRPAAAVCLGPGLLVGALLAAELAALVMLLTAEDTAALLEPVTVVAAALPVPVVTTAVAEALPVVVVVAAVAQVALVGKLVAPLFLQKVMAKPAAASISLVGHFSRRQHWISLMKVSSVQMHLGSRPQLPMPLTR